MRKEFAFLFFALVFTACSTTNKSFQSSPVLSRQVQLDPIKADIIVNEQAKLTGQSTSVYFLFFRLQGDKTYADGIQYNSDVKTHFLSSLDLMSPARLKKVRAAAAYKALSGGNYDFMIHPNYTLTTKNFLFLVKTYKAEVTGYGAYYKNFRTEKQKILIAGDKEYIVNDNNK